MVYLKKRDVFLLQTLGAYELLCTRQLLALVFPNIRKTTALRRLRKLESERLIKRTNGLKGGEFIWSLTVNGANHIHRDSFLEKINRNSLEHDVLLNDIRIEFERIKLVTSWHTEQAIRREAAKNNSDYRNELNPDAIISVRTPKGNQAIAIELELFVKNSSRYKKTFCEYSYIKNIWAVWYVVPNVTLGKRLMKEWQKYVTQGPEFYFILVEDILGLNSAIKLHGVNGDRIIQKSAHTSAHSVSRGEEEKLNKTGT